MDYPLGYGLISMFLAFNMVSFLCVFYWSLMGYPLKYRVPIGFVQASY